MPAPNFLLLYVEDSQASATFYEHLFGIAPAAVFPTYAAFEFDTGLTFGLWSTKARDFRSGGSGHRSELAFLVPDDAEVRALHDRWQAAGVPMEQPPHQAVFGLTFVATDPNGHRIRVCTPRRVRARGARPRRPTEAGGPSRALRPSRRSTSWPSPAPTRPSWWS